MRLARQDTSTDPRSLKDVCDSITDHWATKLGELSPWNEKAFAVVSQATSGRRDLPRDG